MQIDFTGRHMEVTKALKDYAEAKVSRMEKYISRPITGAVTLSVQKYRHIAEISIKIDGSVLKAVEETEEMYSSIDKALDKIERQVRKYKEKLTEHKNYEEFPEQIGIEEKRFDIINDEPYKVESMTPEKAAGEMEIKNKECFAFTNSFTGKINIIYKKTEGNLGLVEPIY